MRLAGLIVQSFLFHRRTNLSVLAGVALAGAVLVGALVVGDSVRYSLRALARARLGKTEVALAGGDRFFTAALADRLSEDLEARTAPALILEGVVSAEGGAVTAPRVQVVGVDERFRAMGPGGAGIELKGDDAAVNGELAGRLSLEPGSQIIVRVRKLSFLPLEAPFAPSATGAQALRARVAAVAGPDEFGRFSLRANHITPPTVFLPMERFSEIIGVAGLANVILAAGGTEALTPARAAATLAHSWRPADAAIEFRGLSDSGEVELRSRRVFISAPIVSAAMEADASAQGVLSYFVNEIAVGERSTPYSVVSAPGLSVIPSGMRDDEIIINEWLAEDLAAGPGDSVHLVYYVLGPTGRLREDSAHFTVHAVTPMRGAAADRTLMPEFPGVAEAESTSDWEPGVPIDLSRVRPKDEAYWKEWRGTPKAFVTLEAAKRMWANRFGELTAVRFPAGAGSVEEIAASVMDRLEPRSLGLVWSDVRDEGLEAAAAGVDFRQLFLGLSFFIAAAALLLTGLLFVLSADERSEEFGILRAVGFRPGTVRRMFLAEGALIAVCGAAAGTAAAVGYDAAVLKALATVWRGAVMTSALRVRVVPLTLLAGGAASAAAGLFAMWVAARRAGAVRPVELTTGTAGGAEEFSKAHPRAAAAIAMAALAGAAALVLSVDPGRSREAAGVFFAGGSLLLISGIASFSAFLALLTRRASGALSMRSMGVRNVARRRGRSIAVVAMLACGVFIVVAIGANRRDAAAGADERSSGTGGFRFHMETTLPVVADLNDREGRRSLGLAGGVWEDVEFVGMRLREGDDASCFNLNRTANPRLLGVDPEALAERDAFSFTKTLARENGGSPWRVLAAPAGESVVPAVADETVIIWGLGKSLGDRLEYIDENGRAFQVRLAGGIANSVLQGSLVISQGAFLERFPSVSGRRVFLIDAPRESAEEVRRELERALSDFGVEVTPAAKRLAAFNTVENTYLSIFLALGGLGLALGSIGLGVIVFRNVLERRSELALLRAVGFSRGALMSLVFWEHWLLFAAGLVTGAVAAGVAVLPAVVSLGAGAPYVTVCLVLAGLAASGSAWVYLATRLATAGRLLGALRRE